MKVNEAVVFHALSPQTAQRLAVSFCFFVAWMLLFLLLYSRPTSRRVLEKTQQGAQKALRLERQELATRLTALIHAALVAVGAASLVFFRPDSPLYVTDLLKWDTWPNFNQTDERAVFYACAEVGYFVADFLLTVVLLEENGMQFLVHAVAGLSGALWCSLADRGLVYLMVLSMFEFSTPFLHIRWIFLDYNWASSSSHGGLLGTLYVINGILLVFSFTLFRIVIGIPVIFKLAYELHFTKLAQTETPAMRYFFTLAGFAMCVLNLTWGKALWLGLLRTVGLIKRKPHDKEKKSRTVAAMEGKEE